MNKSLLALIFSTVLFFGGGELAARLFLSHSNDALDLTRGVLIADEQLLWKNAPRLDTQFLGFPLLTDTRGWRIGRDRGSDAGTYRVLILGPSSTFGWGVAHEDTYSHALQALIPQSAVINAGEIGYSSAQGVRLATDGVLREIQPQVTVLAYGINDLDRYRFFFQSTRDDRDEFAQMHASSSVFVMNALRRSAFVYLLAKISSVMILGHVSGEAVQRVSVDTFIENERALIHKATSVGSHVVIMTTTTYYAPTVTGRTSDGRDRATEVARITEGVERMNARLRILSDEESVPLLDIDQVFGERDRKALFVDPIHFSKEGNALVAEALSRIIEAWRAK